MTVAIGSDPNVVSLKSEVIEELIQLGHEPFDMGSEDTIYAKVAIKVAEAVVKGKYDRGIVMCGTGIGVSIVANKVPGAYCALVTDVFQAERAALSNNANIIAMGQQVTGNMTARMIVRSYMGNTEKFNPEGRSGPKVQYIADYESRRVKN